MGVKTDPKPFVGFADSSDSNAALSASPRYRSGRLWPAMSGLPDQAPNSGGSSPSDGSYLAAS